MDITNGHGSLGWRSAVAGVGLTENAASGKRACNAIKDSAEDHPPVVECLRVFGAEDGDNLTQNTTAGCKSHQLSSAIAIREMAQLWSNNGTQATDDEVECQHEFSDVSLNGWNVALRVVGPQHNGLIGELGVSELFVSKVLLADKI